jgi:cytochrome c-type biogenesis protein CcmH
MIVRRYVLLMLVIGLLIAVPHAFAQDTTVSDDDVNEIAGQLYCPVCENVPLDVCPTTACANWRAEIRNLLEQGYTEGQVKAYFVERYGQRVLATPQAHGFDILVWGLPVIGLLIGAGMLAAALRRLTPPDSLAAAQPPAIDYSDLDPQYVARLEQELEEFS